MSSSQGCTDNKAVVESFKEALLGRIGADRYRMWFDHGVEFEWLDGQPSDDAVDADAMDDHVVDDHVVDDHTVDDHTVAGTPESVSAQRLAEGDFDAVDPVCASASDSVVQCAQGAAIRLTVRGQFALERVRNHFMPQLRGAAHQAIGRNVRVELCLHESEPEQIGLPLENSEDQPDSDVDDSSGTHLPSRTHQSGAASRGRRRQRSARSVGRLLAEGKEEQDNHGGAHAKQLAFPELSEPASAPATPPQSNRPRVDSQECSGGDDSEPTAVTLQAKAMTIENLVVGPCNQLAYTALTMACQQPSTATPLFLCGPTGTGKSHMMTAIADQFRRRHRMRRVIHLSAEQFTNDFISSVGNSGITAFRRRYREVDALLIDDVQFLGAKKATLRELLYTVETLATAGRPLVFSGLRSPTETEGLLQELAGRMAAGLVCSLQPLDAQTRETILRRWLQQRCIMPVDDELVSQLVPMLAGDGRVISGVVNVIHTLQRMYGQSPTLDQIRQHAGDLLRASRPVATMSVIEAAVCETFHLPSDVLRGGSQTRAITGPRMLAMYLSRQLTSSAYSEIARHFGGKSHSTAISAENNVKSWLANGKPIGRGHQAMSAQEAINRVEARLRSG